MKNNGDKRFKPKRNKEAKNLFKIIICIFIILILILIHKGIKKKSVKTAVNLNNAESINISKDANIDNNNEAINEVNAEEKNNITMKNETSEGSASSSSQSRDENSLIIENTNNKENSKKQNEANKASSGSTSNDNGSNSSVLSDKGLPVLMYHFFYDDVKYFKRDNNWLKISDFEAQVKYMSENNFYFPTWDEVEKYVDGKAKLPAKSVVITVDDGDPSFFDLAVPILQKYNVTATSFVVTSWYGYRYDPDMKNVVFESHSDNMHQSGANGKGRMVNWSYDEIIRDIKTSSHTLGNCDVFCYPFGHYNDTAMKALKDANYKLAFTVEGGRVKPGQNKYKLPRVRVSDGNSLKYFIGSIS